MERLQAVTFFSDLFKGRHHIPAPGCEGEHGVRTDSDGSAWHVNLWSANEVGQATWDDDLLTRAVFLAHDRCVRLSITARGRYLRISISPRKRDGSIMEGHPTLEDRLAMWRRQWPENEVVK